MPHSTSTWTGSLGEMAFERHFFVQGRLITAPKFDVYKIDFVVEWENRLAKVQVKTMSFNKGTKKYTVNISTRDNGLNRAYKAEDVDYFGIVNLEYDKIWLIPYSATLGRRTLTWIDPKTRCFSKKAAFDWPQYLIN